MTAPPETPKKEIGARPPGTKEGGDIAKPKAPEVPPQAQKVPQQESEFSQLESIVRGKEDPLNKDERGAVIYFENCSVRGLKFAGRDFKDEKKGKRARSTSYVDRESVRSAAAVFETDAKLDQLVSHLKTARIAAIHGAADLGARQLALAALGAMVKEGLISELGQVVAWWELRAASFEKGVGYTVEVTGGDSGASHVRRSLGEKLQSSGAFLIVRYRGSQPSDHDVVLENWALTPATMLERLLRHSAGTGVEPEQLDQVLCDKGVRQTLEELTSYATIDQLATGLAATLHSGGDPRAVIARMRRSGERALLEWFTRNESPELRCHLIAAAVLDGLPWSMVADAARDLESRLQPEPKSEKAIRGFGLSREQIADRIEADIKPVQLALNELPLRMDGVRLRNREWIDRAFDVATSRFVGARDALLAWLREMGLGQNNLLAERLGRTAAFLADRDFPDALSHVLTPWAEADRAVSRQALAAAFECYGEISGSDAAPLMAAVLKAWLQSPPLHALARTAMSVLSLSWGWRNRERMLELLRERVLLVGFQELSWLVIVLTRVVAQSERPGETLAVVLDHCRTWKKEAEVTEQEAPVRGPPDVADEMVSMALVLLLFPADMLDYMGENKELFPRVNRLLTLTARRPQGDGLRELAIKYLLALVEAAHALPERRETLRQFLAVFGLADEQLERDRQRLASFFKSKLHEKPFARFAEELAEQLLRAPTIVRGNNVRSQSNPHPVQQQKA